jgi:hypothetical protein
MPRKPVDYSKTIMYKIVCNDLNIKDVYVGNTTDFRKRKNKHKCDCNNQNSKGYNIKLYQMIRQNGGWDNWSMIEIEKYCCKDSNEATARERYWLETLNANMNTLIPNRSNIESCKAYYQANKKILCEKKIVYYQANKEKKNEYNEQYYKNNKEKLNQIVNCDCGGKYKYKNKSQHFKSKKHQNFMTLP